MVRGPPHQQVPLVRPFLRRGVPPFFYRYDQGFMHWLYWNDKKVEFLSDTDVEALARRRPREGLRPDRLRGPHRVRDRRREYDAVERFRNLGGNLIFLSANNFFWRVTRADDVLTQVAMWRDIGRPEAALIGVQYLANDRGERQGDFVLRNNGDRLALGGHRPRARLVVGDAVGGYGIEIDHVTSDSPLGTTVVAEIPDLFGPGLTAEMTYYETTNGREGLRRRRPRLRRLRLDVAGQQNAREPLGAPQRPLEVGRYRSASGSSFRAGIGDGSSQTKPARAPIAAIQSVSRTPIALPRTPPRNAPTGRTP